MPWNYSVKTYAACMRGTARVTNAVGNFKEIHSLETYRAKTKRKHTSEKQDIEMSIDLISSG